MTPEGKVKKQIKAYLDELGCYHRWPVPTGFGKSGLDCYGCYKGRFFEVEIKRAGVFEPTPRQRMTIREVHAALGVAFTTDSVARCKKYFQDHLGAPK